VDAATPGQHPRELPLLGDGVRVAFQPAVAALLRLADLAFAIGGAVCLLTRQGAGSLGEGELLARLGELAAV